MAPRRARPTPDRGSFSVSMLDRAARFGAGLPQWLAAVILAALLALVWTVSYTHLTLPTNREV